MLGRRPRLSLEDDRVLVGGRDAVLTAWSRGSTDGVATEPLSVLVERALTATTEPDRRAAAWLLLVVLSGSLPSVQQLDDATVALGTGGAAALLAAAVLDAPDRVRDLAFRGVGGTLVDVSITARSDSNAGVPRVVRELVAGWGEPPGVHYVAWDAFGYRTLDEQERTRLALGAAPALPAGTRVVPLGARLVVTEVLRPEAHAVAVEAMASAGAVELSGIVYDLSALVGPDADATRGPFLQHLSALSGAERLSGISASVVDDVGDYFSLFQRNGRGSPQLAAHLLPESGPLDLGGDAVARLAARLRGDPDWPVVLVVSSIYRRKNHGRLLAACERLWQEGLRFRLLAIEGTVSQVPGVGQAMGRLAAQGRPVTVLSRVPEDELLAAYRLAAVTAYVSLAEGYGLPIVESLAAGTPVVASGHGSMGELAGAGGVVTVDPRRDDSIADALRRVLTQPGLLEELRAQATGRAASSWADYARTVGTYLGVLDDAHRPVTT